MLVGEYLSIAQSLADFAYLDACRKATNIHA